jgi:hypothetical protein
VIDSGGSYRVGAALREAIRARTDKPIRYVINTHVHSDHIFGNAAFEPDGPEFIGHAQLPRAMRLRAETYEANLKTMLGEAAEGSRVVLPTQTIANERVIDLGNRRLLLKAWAIAHTDHDLTVMDERTASVLIPPGSLPGYSSPAGITYDPEGARKLLAEAGYPGGKGMPTVDILFNRDAGHDVIAQAVASDWERNLGVSVSLSQREIKVFRNDLKQKNYMVSRAAWFGDYGDPLTFLDLNRTGDGNNDRGFSYKPYDNLLEAADAELDADKRYDILSQAEKMVIEEQAPMIPIFHYNQVYLFDPHVLSGISPHPRQKQYLFLVDKLDPAAEPTKALEMPARPPAGAAK